MLGKLIDQIGLEDAGELVALASTEQLVQIFDEDLWKTRRPGEDERFDSERFLLWLELLLESGDRAVAERLAELPLELLTLALHRHVMVLSLEDLRAELTAGDDEAEAAEKAFESRLNEELDEYQLIWRGGEGWDSVLAALLALDRDHHSVVVDVLERCAHLTSEYIADNGGLYQVLTAEDTLEEDLAAERETRRAERGYVAPSAAAAFLRLASGPTASETPFTEHDPLTRAYFRQLSRAPQPAAPAPHEQPEGQRRDLAQLLAASGIVADRAPRLLLGKGEACEPLVVTALRKLAQSAPETFAERSEELAYLTNVLLAAEQAEGNHPRPMAAVQRALEGVSRGLATACGEPEPSVDQAVAVLLRYPCDGLWRLASSRAAPERRDSRRQYRTSGRN